MTSVTHDTFDPTEGERLASQLTARTLPTVDFDRLCEWLQAASGQLARATEIETQLADSTRRVGQLEHEYQVLREDYLARIAGMLKAVAIAERSRRNLDSLAEVIESLESMSAEELTRCYRKTAACFRDHFPGTLPRK